MAKFIRKFLVISVTALLLSGQVMVALAQDTTPPSDVEGLEAFPGDGEVTLSWETSTDDTGVSGYFIYSGLTSVTEGGGDYTFGSTDIGDTLSYTMEGLSNGVTYYFAMTAYDEEGNQSEFYSLEVEGTPETAEVGDFTAPTVSDANALTSTLVEVQFSEDVVLPDDATSVFSLEATDGTFLEVFDAYLSADDSSVVFVITDTQTAGAEYILTTGSEIEDNAGNPIVSGTSDTAIFTGSSLDEEPVDEEPAGDEDEEVTEFNVVSVTSNELDKVVVEFTSPVAVADPDSFMLVNEDGDALEVIMVEFVEVYQNTIVLTTEGMEAGYEYTLTLDEGVLNEDGEPIVDVYAYEASFLAKTLDLSDLIAPEDVTEFLGKILNESSVELTWVSSLDSAGDLANYLIYKSSDEGSTFGNALSLAKDLGSYTYDGLTPGSTYTFKLTAEDENGNESEGVLTTVTLPETGPGMLALGGLSLLGAGFARRKKKNALK